jgi:O-antigen/teichoic acid export membrane protein
LISSILVAFASMASPIILILIGEKWSESIYYTQLLCIPGILYPLQILNLNILNLKGFSNLNLKLEIIKKLILIPLVLLTIGFSIEILIYGLILFSFIEFFINSYYTKKIISYNISSQLKDLIPYILISISYFLLVFTITFFRLNNYEMLTCQLLVSFMFYAFIIKFIRVKELDELVDVFKKHIKK